MMRMFRRMSWDAPPFSGHNPHEHVHGPNCECNPESALRVQFLRLVHNFVDRDFHNNPIADILLSPQERLDVLHGEGLPLDYGRNEHGRVDSLGLDDYSFLTDDSQGLVVKITKVLIREPHNSMYRFWLSSCVESFLRSTGPFEQRFLLRSTDVLPHLADLITGKTPGWGAGTAISNLQTTFDLLGEIVKYNTGAVELLESHLLEHQVMDRFLAVLISELVDSNVFLRSLVLTVEKLGQRCENNEKAEPKGESCSDEILYLPPSCVNAVGSSGTVKTNCSCYKSTSV